VFLNPDTSFTGWKTYVGLTVCEKKKYYTKPKRKRIEGRLTGLVTACTGTAF
jgi:hypothetical protein